VVPVSCDITLGISVIPGIGSHRRLSVSSRSDHANCERLQAGRCVACYCLLWSLCRCTDMPFCRTVRCLGTGMPFYRTVRCMSKDPVTSTAVGEPISIML
jgi:hypothetical protein